MSKTTQYDQVVAVVEKLGGIATLSQLYDKVDVSGWGTKTSSATIRRIAQMDKRLFKIKPGLYCLLTQKDKFIKQFDEKSNKPEVQRHNHSFFQGVLLQIGQKRGLATYIPRQDSRKRFLPSSDSLGDMSGGSVMPKFGYPEFMRHAKTVDVAWFNERDMPCAFFEVEMTTDMGRSLEKFGELQDFHATMAIVAPRSRRRYFEDKISRQVYKEIRKRVKFQPTDEILGAQKHLKAANSASGILVR